MFRRFILDRFLSAMFAPDDGLGGGAGTGEGAGSGTTPPDGQDTSLMDEPGTGGGGDTDKQKNNIPPDGQDTSLMDETDPEGGDIKTESKAPEKYADFQLPEGFTFEPAALEKATGVFKKLNLSQEAAQELINLEAEFLQNQTRANLNEWNKVKNNWREETLKIPGFADDKKYVGKVIDQIMGKELGSEFRKLMKDTGLGNHPIMNKAMILIGKQIGEDRFEEGKPSPVSPKTGIYNNSPELK